MVQLDAALAAALFADDADATAAVRAAGGDAVKVSKKERKAAAAAAAAVKSKAPVKDVFKSISKPTGGGGGDSWADAADAAEAAEAAEFAAYRRQRRRERDGIDAASDDDDQDDSAAAASASTSASPSSFSSSTRSLSPPASSFPLRARGDMSKRVDAVMVAYTCVFRGDRPFGKFRQVSNYQDMFVCVRFFVWLHIRVCFAENGRSESSDRLVIGCILLN
jgi:hypothetical protein